MRPGVSCTAAAPGTHFPALARVRAYLGSLSVVTGQPALGPGPGVAPQKGAKDVTGEWAGGCAGLSEATSGQSWRHGSVSSASKGNSAAQRGPADGGVSAAGSVHLKPLLTRTQTGAEVRARGPAWDRSHPNCTQFDWSPGVAHGDGPQPPLFSFTKPRCTLEGKPEFA